MPANPTLLEPLPRNRHEVRRWFKRNTTRQERLNRIKTKRTQMTNVMASARFEALSQHRKDQIIKAIYDGGDSVRKRKERKAARDRAHTPGS